MKRPEGFDRTPPPAAQPARPAKPPRASNGDARPRGSNGDARQRGSSGDAPPRGTSSPKSAARPRPAAAARPKPAKDTSARDARREAKAEATEARREARAATAARRRYQMQEMRRFTRRQRARRIAVGATLGTVGLVVVLILVAIFSPILALRTVTVEGASRVDAAAVRTGVEGQLGTPLALIDYGRIDAVLREFPVIRSYTTETIPPGTMVIHITEREPVVSVAGASGEFLLVDAAGVTVERAAVRPAGLPLVTESGTTLPNPAFDAAVEVLLAMPDALRDQIDTITAKTRDDVWLTLAGVTQAVKWGSADDSATKVRLLELLRGNFGATPGTFDVSATSNGIFRPA